MKSRNHTIQKAEYTSTPPIVIFIKVRTIHCIAAASGTRRLRNNRITRAQIGRAPKPRTHLRHLGTESTELRYDGVEGLPRKSGAPVVIREAFIILVHRRPMGEEMRKIRKTRHHGLGGPQTRGGRRREIHSAGGRGGAGGNRGLLSSRRAHRRQDPDESQRNEGIFVKMVLHFKLIGRHR